MPFFDDDIASKLYDLEKYKEPKSGFQQDAEKSMDRYQKVNDFLNTVSMIESSGGKNFNHEELQSGIHKGHRAAGTYGLMPNTIDETINRMQRDNYDMEFAKPIIENKDPKFVKDYVEQNPDVEKKLARYLASNLLDKTNFDKEKAAYMWNTGHNQKVANITDKYTDHPYTEKFRKIKKQLNIK